MDEAFVDVNSLGKVYGTFAALRDCTLQVRDGQVLGLLGPNGAGKSTLIRLIMGFLRPTSGSARIQGQDCYRQRTSVHRLVAYLPGDARLPRMMRARAVLKFFSSLRPEASLARAEALADRLELDLTRWVGLMSTGMRQKLALAVTLSIDSPLLILDEPTANLDPSVRGEVLNLVAESREAGRTVIFSSHVLSEIEEICERVCILRAGELVHHQSLAAVDKAHTVEARLLGDLPSIPEQWRDLVRIRENNGRLFIATQGDLQVYLGWLSSLPVSDLQIQPAGLRSVYDRFHGNQRVPAETVQ